MGSVRYNNLYIYIYIYREREREREIGSSYIKSYTFFKSLDLNRSNSKKKTFVNANILIDLIYYPLFNIFHTYLLHTFFLSPLHLSLSLSLFARFSLYLLHSFSSSTAKPLAGKKKVTTCLTLINNKTIIMSFCCYV